MARPLVRKFTAKGDVGKKYTLLEYHDRIEAGTHDDPNGWIPGMKSLVTSDGLKVNQISPGDA